MKQQIDVAVIGAGAAGLFCAGEASKRGRSVVVFEHNAQIGRKILISGGGRCNFTNVRTGPENFLSGNPHFAKSALARYTPRHFVELVDRRGIPWHEKKLGQLFCDRSARDIVELLAAEAAGARIVTNCKVLSIERGFRLETTAGEWEAESVVIAAGGLSIPKIGASDFGLRIARQFGHAIAATRPGLVPLTLAEPLADLSGVAADVAASVNGARFEDRMLVTHRGLSGPVILQVSSYWAPGGEVALRFTGEAPKRLRRVWPEDEVVVRPDGTEGYAKAEVMAGGVDTAGLDSKTMASRTVAGLYFIGEVVDVTGWLGGYNFQWAWASGWAAGRDC